MASLLLVTGPPGAGKSTVAQVVAAGLERSALVSGDAFFGFVQSGFIAPWLPEANDQNEIVTQAAASAAGRYVAGGYTTVYDGVVGPWFLPTFLAAAGLDFLHYLILLPPLEQCAGRIATRGGHGFTDEDATRKMYEEFVRADIDERHLLRNPPDGVEAAAERVLMALATDQLRYPSAE